MPFSVFKRLFNKAPAPEPEAAAPVRRRQLRSFAEQDADETPAEQPLPLPVLPDPSPAIADTDPAEDAEPFGDEPPSYGDYAGATMARLEEAFGALESGEIALDEYRRRIVAEQAAVERRIAELAPEIESDELDGALTARESVRWCLDWADEQEARR